MKKLLKIIIITLIIIFVIIISFFYIAPQIILHPNCFFSGGKWVYFSTPCTTDECKWIDNPAEGCIQVMAASCDCGPEKCWDGEKCVPNPRSEEISSKKYCEKDSDCVPASCCHPTETINKNYAPDCSNGECTEECGGPLDCGCGKPVCENNKCKIKKISSESWCNSFFN